MTANEAKKMLEKEYPYRIEMHAHTSPQSMCGELSPSELAELYARKGYDGIVITNHFMGCTEWAKDGYMSGATKEEKLKNYLAGYEDARACGERLGIKVYLGLEIRFARESDNDYLLYGADGEIASRCYDYLEGTLEEFRKDVRFDKSVFIQAHPFRDGSRIARPELLDGIETFNMHPGQNSRVGFAVRCAKENNMKIVTAGSDFHHRDKNHEAVSALRTRRLPEDSFGLAEILKSGDYVFEIGEASIVLP